MRQVKPNKQTNHEHIHQATSEQNNRKQTDKTIMNNAKTAPSFEASFLLHFVCVCIWVSFISKENEANKKQAGNTQNRQIKANYLPRPPALVLLSCSAVRFCFSGISRASTTCRLFALSPTTVDDINPASPIIRNMLLFP